MKLMYTDEIVKNAIHQILNKEKIDFLNIKYPVVGILMKKNGEKSLTNCFMDISEKGILVVLLHAFHVEEIIGYQFFQFENIQGIKIKNGFINIKMTFQFNDGTNYKFQFKKSSSRWLLNQKENIENIVYIFESRQLNNMINEEYKKELKSRRLSEFIYVSTLSLIEIIGLYIYYGLFHLKNFFGVVILILFLFGIHFVGCIFINTFLYKIKNKKFWNEYMPIIEEYQRDHNAPLLLNSLNKMKEKPKTQEAQNDYNLSLSTAYYHLNNQVKAKDYLLKIRSKDRKYLSHIENQLKLIEEMNNH